MVPYAPQRRTGLSEGQGVYRQGKHYGKRNKRFKGAGALRKERQEAIALDLLMMNSLEAVAEKHSISKSALYNLRKNPDFKAICADQKRQIFGESAAKLQGYSLEAVEILISVMRSPTAPDAIKVNAARIMLENGKTAYEREEILPKLEELEKQMNAIERK